MSLGVEARAGRFPGPSLIPLLEAVQAEHGWLPREQLVRLSREMKRPLYEIQGLVSFYPHFRTHGPPPTAEVSLCHDLSCWLHDGERQVVEARERLDGEGDVEVHEASCLGRCDLAPACTVNGHPGRIAEAGALVEAARAGALQPAAAKRPGRVWPNDPYAGADANYRVLRRALSGDLDADAIIEALDGSGLRGMGGAGFPTASKWRLVRDQPGPVKYAICNADESEPGTFKDRQILAEQPHLVIEGMLLGMHVAGCPEGTVFVRHEYGPETRVIREEIARVRALGLLEEMGATLEVFVSPGGYILGEETALIECMEGHRGEPRNKPPFPGVFGLWGKPTLMNSVETFAHVPVILERGADWWRSQGLRDSTGLKFLSVSGHVARPDVYCVPMGTTLREVLDLAGGVAGPDGETALGAVQPGGASSNFLPPAALDTPLDFGTLQEAGSMLGSGAMCVVAAGTPLLAAATNVLRFFRDESCGKCVPCRTGTEKAHRILTDLIAAGGGARDVDERIADLEEAMRLTSICGLGQVALGPVMSVVRMAEPAVPDEPEDPPQAGRASASDEP